MVATPSSLFAIGYSLLAIRYSLTGGAPGLEQIRSGPQRVNAARGFESLVEVFDLLSLRFPRGTRGARPLNRWNLPGGRRLGLGLRLPPERGVADQQLHAVVAHFAPPNITIRSRAES